ncbi:histidine phosphatase family protein [Beijerinckia sp. L45]|uniref:histidine phosphatase family protein n=1 Tax=Beijerinckia sp. L45 TaxID=1641855 RepID=UPI00131C0835|nr:histidine phosphatase family protein [Beijerinckia sp. L45]
MTGRLILVAHAETEATRSAAFPFDEPLAARGAAAAARYATALPQATRILRSPAVAAAETAAAFGCEATVDPMLADLDCGRWRGRPLGAIADEEPEALGAWLADPSYEGHGGGSIAALLIRVGQWLEAGRTNRGTMLAITHGAVVRCAALAVLGASANGFWRLDVAPLTRLDLSSDGRRWVLRQIVQIDARPADQK